jgi:hypothetical protein
VVIGVVSAVGEDVGRKMTAALGPEGSMTELATSKEDTEEHSKPDAVVVGSVEADMEVPTSTFQG